MMSFHRLRTFINVLNTSITHVNDVINRCCGARKRFRAMMKHVSRVLYFVFGATQGATCLTIPSSTLALVCLAHQGDRPKLVGSDWTVETGGDQWDAGIVEVLDEEFQKANGGLSLMGDAMAITRYLSLIFFRTLAPPSVSLHHTRINVLVWMVSRVCTAQLFSAGPILKILTDHFENVDRSFMAANWCDIFMADLVYAWKS